MQTDDRGSMRSNASLRSNASNKPLNKHLFVRDEDRASIRSTGSNSPRRTPEVEVSPLPPGFAAGQEEKGERHGQFCNMAISQSMRHHR